MGKPIDLSHIKTTEHISFISSDFINQLCAPILTKLNLNAFSYSKIYIDGSRLELWTDAYALEHTFITSPYLLNVYSPDLIGNDRYCVYEYKVKNYTDKLVELYYHQLNDQKEIYNHANCFFIINREPTYTEYFVFYSPKSNTNAINMYYNHLDEMNEFVKYFLANAKDIIKKADANRLIPAWRDVDPRILKRKEYNPNNDGLSPQEKRVAYMIMAGESAKTIAFNISVTPKTAENYIANIKRKIGTNSKRELIKKLYRMGYRMIIE